MLHCVRCGSPVFTRLSLRLAQVCLTFSSSGRAGSAVPHFFSLVAPPLTKTLEGAVNARRAATFEAQCPSSIGSRSSSSISGSGSG